jgi:predicted dehydrogenase
MGKRSFKLTPVSEYVVAREYYSLFNEDKIESLMLCDLDKSNLVGFNRSIKTCTQIEDLFHKVDAIHVCTPNITHFEIAKKALTGGINVLVEKPMTIDHRQAYELIEFAASKNLILQVGHIFRFSNVIRKIRDLFQNGLFGEPYYFLCTWTHQMPYTFGVDILWDLLPHPLDILNFVIKKWPSTFVGFGRAYRRKKLNCEEEF